MHEQLENYLKEVRTQLRSLPAGKQDEELREIRQHLQALIAGNVERGDSEDKAVAAAIRQFGSSKQVGQSLRQAQTAKGMMTMTKIMQKKKLFLVVFTILHMAVIAAMLAAGNNSSFFPFAGLPGVSPWLMGVYVLLSPLVSPVLWLHFNYFNSTLFSSTSLWPLYLLSLLNSFVWAWLAWNVSSTITRRRTI